MITLPTTTDTVVYFAYGSNMSTARLRARAPSCKQLGRAVLVGHDLRFHKYSTKDGTAKCDAYRTGVEHDTVLGVLFEIAQNDKAKLDRAEGLGYGYNEKTVLVRLEGGQEVEAVIYYADTSAVRSGPLPSREYKQHVLDGAREHGLSAEYIASRINNVSTCD